MEKRKLKLLKFFLNNCSNGYKVLDVSKIYQAIRSYKKTGWQSLLADIEHLKQCKYIDVKHIDENNICLCILDNSHVFQENLRSDKAVNRKYLISLAVSAMLCGIMSFLGAFLAIKLLG